MSVFVWRFHCRSRYQTGMALQRFSGQHRDCYRNIRRLVAARQTRGPVESLYTKLRLLVHAPWSTSWWLLHNISSNWLSSTKLDERNEDLREACHTSPVLTGRPRIWVFPMRAWNASAWGPAVTAWFSAPKTESFKVILCESIDFSLSTTRIVNSSSCGVEPVNANSPVMP